MENSYAYGQVERYVGMENYLQLLDESLTKKTDVLRRIEECNKEQEEILLAPKVSMESFDAVIDKKGVLIDEINSLDAGFEQLYDRIREQLQRDSGKYKRQIALLQKKIGEVTGLSVSVQAQELRNKKLAEEYFARERRELRKGRVSTRAAMGYYKSMSQSAAAMSQVLDKKK